LVFEDCCFPRGIVKCGVGITGKNGERCFGGMIGRDGDRCGGGIKGRAREGCGGVMKGVGMTGRCVGMTDRSGQRFGR
jgi:hypothetical protein